MSTNETTIDDRAFQGSIRRLAAMDKRELPVLVRQTARRVCVNLARTTAPFGFGASARQQGEQAVRTDHFRVYATLGRLAKNLDEEQRRQLAWLSENATPRTVTKFLNAAGIKVEYRRRANKKTIKGRRIKSGRVRNNQTPIEAAPQESIDRLINRAVKRVGLAKKGWADCARQLGGIRGIPSWVHRSRGVALKEKQPGSVSTNLTPGGVTYTMTNNLPYASRMISSSGVRRALNRERDFLRAEIARRINRNWKTP